MSDTPEIAGAKRKLELQATECPNWARQLLDYIAQLERRWIPIAEKVPQDREWKGIKAVLAANAREVFITQTHPGWWNHKDERGREFDGPEITHWMPLPAAPDRTVEGGQLGE